MEPDPLGRAILDYQRGGLRGDCVCRDGAETRDGNIEGHYFASREDWRDEWRTLLASLEPPVVDIGCGSGQHAEFLQERGEVVAIDVSPGAVEATRNRGVEDVRVMDMFEIDFRPDRFRSALLSGTQLGLAHSLAGVRRFLSELARITDEEGVAVVDNYDPTDLAPDDLLGYRSDPRRGIAHRTFHFEYDRDGEREVGRTLHFVLFSPERLRDVTVGTPWHVAEVQPREGFYKAVLRKETR
ncbi:class I SAM-dependent methyltransferase [Haladaptatus sp. T7]|uniref:class I SAM-dependent methyltransferase n=1 Tax=Haladaptatus sp. T7 TaxID=2029368 RepID=UPI0021A25A6E|nr:class I SAM-dependent methyltransferase [Haladaptatus sp. T7]GKZ14918.1 SAM-dependent methyltransferase [Haladaptatus sp. T7]